MSAPSSFRVISLAELQGLVPLSRSQIWRLEQQGEFPRRIRIGRRRIGYLVSDIDDWLASRRAASAGPLGPSRDCGSASEER